MKAVLALEMADFTAKFEMCSVDAIGRQRVQCLVRGVALTKEVCRTFEEGEKAQLSEETVAAVARMQLELHGAKSWLDATAADMGRINEGWCCNGGLVQEAMRVATERLQRVFECWKEECQAVVHTLAALLPSKGMVDDPAILQDATMQQALRAKVDELVASPARGQGNLFSTLIKGYESGAGTLWEAEVKEELHQIRREAKRAIAVDFVIDEITNRLPEQASALPAHAKRIQQILQKKGVGEGAGAQVSLPGFLRQVLENMQKVGTAQA